MFFGCGAVTPGPSHKHDITFFVKVRLKSVQQLCDSKVAARRVQSVTVLSSRVETRMCAMSCLNFLFLSVFLLRLRLLFCFVVVI